MIHTLDDYIWRSLPEEGPFATNPALREKVDSDGQFLPYRGNTLVFLLDEDTKAKLAALQEQLYCAAPEMLAAPLQKDTFHMTLHDLIHGPADDGTLPLRMEPVSRMAEELLSQWREDDDIPMRASWVFNMVNTSVVLGLVPAGESAWRKLDEMYGALERIVPLGYALTPHITLAYFRPGVYGQQAVQRLRGALRRVELDVTMRMENLTLQVFEDMNRYTAAAESHLTQRKKKEVPL